MWKIVSLFTSPCVISCTRGGEVIGVRMWCVVKFVLFRTIHGEVNNNLQVNIELKWHVIALPLQRLTEWTLWSFITTYQKPSSRAWMLRIYFPYTSGRYRNYWYICIFFFIKVQKNMKNLNITEMLILILKNDSADPAVPVRTAMPTHL